MLCGKQKQEGQELYSHEMYGKSEYVLPPTHMDAQKSSINSLTEFW